MYGHDALEEKLGSVISSPAGWLTPEHVPTGNTRHFHGREPIPAPKELLIVQYSTDPGFYLIHLDEAGNELTDTYHDTIEDAYAQAKWEFQVSESEWEIAGVI